MKKVITTSSTETQKLGAEVASKSVAGDIFGLIGDLGCGKTEFTRGFTTQLAENETVSSPSFSLINTYSNGTLKIHHFDFYRLNNADELIEIGFEEYTNDSDAIIIIEWADMFPEILPNNIQKIYFSQDPKNPDNRIIEL